MMQSWATMTEKKPEKCHLEQLVSRQGTYLGTPHI